MLWEISMNLHSGIYGMAHITVFSGRLFFQAENISIYAEIAHQALKELNTDCMLKQIFNKDLQE
jgi:hypothetical protein